MPEGDAVWRTARRLHTALAGAAVVASDLRVPALATVDLSGRRTVEVVSRGKHLLHRLEGDLTLHSHLRMEGRWKVYRGRGREAVRTSQRHTIRAIVTTGAVAAVGESLGMLDLVRTTREDQVVGHLGPDLLDPAYDGDVAVANLMRRPECTVTEALLDQRNLAGIGTIFASEPLFLHALHPWALVGEVGEDAVTEIVETARGLLVRSCRLGRTTITGRTDTLDDAWVHGRVGLPCLRCATTIRLAPIGAQPRERVMFYCPSCQGGLAPTDDGARQEPLGHGRERRA